MSDWICPVCGHNHWKSLYLATYAAPLGVCYGCSVIFNDPDKFCKKPEGPTLALEPGRFYRTSGGDKMIVVEINENNEMSIFGLYHTNTGHWKPHTWYHYDLVSYWEDE